MIMLEKSNFSDISHGPHGSLKVYVTYCLENIENKRYTKKIIISKKCHLYICKKFSKEYRDPYFNSGYF